MDKAQMTASEKQKEIHRAMWNKHNVLALWKGTWYEVHSCYCLNDDLHIVINMYVIPDMYQIENAPRQEYALAGLRLHEITSALDEKKNVKVWNDGIMYQAGGYERGSFTKILVRRSVVPDMYQIQKCKEHPACKYGHCHEPGCKWYEEPCDHVIKQMEHDMKLEQEAEQRNQEPRYYGWR